LRAVRTGVELFALEGGVAFSWWLGDVTAGVRAAALGAAATARGGGG